MDEYVAMKSSLDLPIWKLGNVDCGNVIFYYTVA